MSSIKLQTRAQASCVPITAVWFTTMTLTSEHEITLLSRGKELNHTKQFQRHLSKLCRVVLICSEDTFFLHIFLPRNECAPQVYHSLIPNTFQLLLFAMTCLYISNENSVQIENESWKTGLVVKMPTNW